MRLLSSTAEADNAADDIDYKDLYFLEPDPSTQQGVMFLARTAFQAAGYEVRQSEKAPCHPFYIFRLRSWTPPRFARERDSRDHFPQLLLGVGLEIPKNAPLLERSGDRLRVVLIWQPHTVQGARTRQDRRVLMDG